MKKKGNRSIYSLIDVCFCKLHILIEFKMDFTRKKNRAYLRVQFDQLQ